MAAGGAFRPDGQTAQEHPRLATYPADLMHLHHPQPDIALTEQVILIPEQQKVTATDRRQHGRGHAPGSFPPTSASRTGWVLGSTITAIPGVTTNLTGIASSNPGSTDVSARGVRRTPGRRRIPHRGRPGTPPGSPHSASDVHHAPTG